MWHLRVVRGAMHSGKKWRSVLWLNAMHSGKKWLIREFILDPFIYILLKSWLCCCGASIRSKYTHISCLFLPAHSCYDRYSLSSNNYELHAFYWKHFWCVSILWTKNVSRFSPCVINLSRNKNICCGLKKVVAKNRARVSIEKQILALLLVFHQTHNLSRNKFARALAK